MSIAPQWFALAGAVTLINGATLGFIARREDDRALKYWAWGWLAWAAAIVPLALGQSLSPTLATLLCGLCWLVSTLYFLRGSYALLGQELPRAWNFIAVGCLVLSAVMSEGPGSPFGMLPVVLFQSAGLLVSGILIIRRARGLVGAWLSGTALVALAVHLLDAPVLASDSAWMSWGFVVAAGLEVLTALGMITMHYEQAHARWLEAERMLAETRRMDALGRVATGVAHDFNNLLTIMQGHLGLMSLEPAPTSQLGESLTAIEQAVEQAARLTSQLLSFGRRSVLQPRTIDVREVVQRTVELVKSAMPYNTQLRFRVGAGAGAYEATLDRALLEQIVLNLVTNARDALGGTGNVEVELERVGTSEPFARLRVADDGCGMDEALLARIFEPFFTTKGEGRGTGLGLACVQGAVSQLGGRIRVRSRVSQGTTFEVELPLGTRSVSTESNVHFEDASAAAAVEPRATAQR
jgi:signal transduction histidine kinase